MTLIFGAPPYYGIHIGTGTHLYCADMSQDPIATAASERIYLHAQRIAELSSFPVDVATITILEELVHVWMNINDEDIAKFATAKLYGGIVAHKGSISPPSNSGCSWRRMQLGRRVISLKRNEERE